MLVKGRSMGLTILEGDRVYWKRVDPLSIRPGDIILYLGSGGLTVHRVIWKRVVEGRVDYLTKGDGSILPDGWVEWRDVIGRVEGLKREGHLFMFKGKRGRAYSLLSFLLSHFLIPLHLIIDHVRPLIPDGSLEVLRGLKKGASRLFARWILPSGR